jgi:tetratricopeptide (TPR) repeat protein
MRYLKYTLTILGFISITNCTSLFVVNSEPGKSDVYYLDSTTKEKKILGQTPYQIDVSELRTKAGESFTSGDFFTVIVEKPGYLGETYNIPTTRFGMLVTQLNAKLKEGNTEAEKRMAKEIIDHIFLAQKFALMQQFERAHIEVDKILTSYPTFPRALSMRATLYYVQKNYIESAKWYEEALKADPQFDEAIKMLARVKDLQSGRLPANTPAASGGSSKGGVP